MKINHIGIACANIDDYINAYGSMWEDVSIGELIVNETQKVKQRFVFFENQISLELLEPLNETSPITKIIAKGGGIYHICYETPDIYESIKSIKEANGFVVCKPISDIAFGGKKIAFLMVKDQLLELLQT